MSEENNKDTWELLKKAFGLQPQEINSIFTLNTGYYEQQLFAMAKGRFKIECPDWWDKDYILDSLLMDGKIFITNTSAGVMPLRGNSSGINVFDRPPCVTITNPILDTLERRLYDSPVLGDNGKVEMQKADACVIYLYDSKWYRSFYPTINHYATKLANIDCSMDVNLINSRVAFIFNATNTKQADEAKAIYDKISSGQPAIYTKLHDKTSGESDGLEVTFLPVKDVYIMDKLIEAKRAIVADFLTELGVNNNPYEKRERLVTNEVESNNEEIKANVRLIKDNLKMGTKRVNAMFPDIPFKIKLRGNKNETKQVQSDIHKEDNS